MSRPTTTRPCAACRRPAKAGHLMCTRCWHAVPKPLQVEVHRTWRAFDRRKTPRDGLASLAAYRSACDTALSAITTKDGN